KGFIPWDDDMDIGMPRSDYDKFIKLCDSELSEKFYITTPSDKRYRCSFAKVQKKNTLFINKPLLHNYREYNEKEGIFVDIFPFDNANNNSFFRLRKKVIWMLRGIILVKLNVRDKEKVKTRYYVEKIVASLFSLRFLKWFRDFLCKLNNNDRVCEYLASFGSHYKPSKIIFLKKELLPVSSVPFEGRRYCAPSNPDYFLRVKFGGDYMNLPPVEDQVTHSPAILSFNTEDEHEKI
ncbi:MAG: LicD family protein, partial [Oscillospiraceae bacterium]|nr:LicD family protein [Oscillospiraceae bacterium]